MTTPNNIKTNFINWGLFVMKRKNDLTKLKTKDVPPLVHDFDIRDKLQVGRCSTSHLEMLHN